MTDPKSFYRDYQKDYHRIKANYLKSMLDDTKKYGLSIFGENMLKDDIDDFRLVLKSDLRQTYFHAIETVFELLFALSPKKDTVTEYYDFTLHFRLTYSNWSETYRKIKDIATIDSALDFLDQSIDFTDRKITVGQYLFYMGIFYQSNFENELKAKVENSIESIKTTLRIIAREFVNREEYNAYKHGLRIVPSLTQITLVPLDDEIDELNFDLSDSMSFYTKMKDPEDIRVITKIFDSERDHRMTTLCSNLIHQMIFYRRILMKLEIDKNKFPTVGYFFYSNQNILDFNKTIVEIQDMVFTQTKIR